MPQDRFMWRWNSGPSQSVSGGRTISRLTRRWNRSDGSVITKRRHNILQSCWRGPKQVFDLISTHPIGSGGGENGGASGACGNGWAAGYNRAWSAGNRSAKKYIAYAGKNTATGTFTNAITQSIRTMTIVPATIAAVIVTGFQASPAPFAAITSTTATIPTGMITNMAAIVDKMVKRTPAPIASTTFMPTYPA